MMRVRCDPKLPPSYPRCGTTWNAEPRPYTIVKKWAEEANFAYPVRVINCPACGRGYFQMEDGNWVANRAWPLTILEGED